MSDTLAAALVAALGAMPAIPKGRKAKIETRGGGSFEYEYADLADVLGAVRPILAEHGLAALQGIDVADGQIGVTTTLLHTSGESMTFGPLRYQASGDPRAMGSTITYLRRYALLGALGVATEDDDDGAAAAHQSDRQARRGDRQDRQQDRQQARGQRAEGRHPPVVERVTITADELDAMTMDDARDFVKRAMSALPDSRRVEVKSEFLSTFGVPPDDLPDSQIVPAVNWLDAVEAISVVRGG